MTHPHTFKAELWRYPSARGGSWYFLSLPKTYAALLKKTYSGKTRGWGSLPVEVRVGTTHWSTSIFPDTKRSTYLLPLKASVRAREKLNEGDRVSVQLTVAGAGVEALHPARD